MSNIKGEVSKKKHLVSNIFSENILTGTISMAENVYVKELRFANYYDFPSLGESNCLYVSKDENAVYRFDAEKQIYMCIGRDYNEIDIIQSTL